MKAGDAFKDTFGKEVQELVAASIVAQLRHEIDEAADRVTAASSL